MRAKLSLLAALAPLLFASTAGAVSNTVVISEFRFFGPNGAFDEFIELHNKSDAPLNVGGYQLRSSNGFGTTALLTTLPPGTTLPAKGFYLLANSGGYTGGTAPDQTYTLQVSPIGGIALLDAQGNTVDQVGSGLGSAYREGNVFFPPFNNGNYGIQRKGGKCNPSLDTDNNASDFELINPAQPFSSKNCCASSVCVLPPDAQCFDAQGTCGSDDKCAYQPKAAGTSCTDNNVCTLNDACNGQGACAPGPSEPCSSPPADFCISPKLLRTFQVPGSCGTPQGCNYIFTDVECPAGCDGLANKCADASCVGKTCEAPPNGCYLSPGTCTGGACDYQEAPAGTNCDDGDKCTASDTCNGSGACVPGAPVPVDDGNPCTVDACDPATGAVTHTPVAAGTSCDDGNLCNGVAACDGSGACVPGAPVDCATPPGACFQAAGVCNPVSGVCTYAPKAAGASCDDGNACTSPDACNGSGTCVGATLVCTPPAPTCVGDTSRSFSGGACDAATGTCTFTQTDTPCPGGCDAPSGLCVGDPCIGVACDQPPSSCHLAQGTCAAGVCNYPLKPAGASCDDGNACTGADQCSAAGACAGAPLLCNNPPLSVCEDAASVRVFAAAGVCDAASGDCSYTSQVLPCPSGCNPVTGACNADPCNGVACNQPPGPCFQDTGTCSEGTCSYELKPAGSGCDDGDECTAADACGAQGQCAGIAVVCATPPPPFCLDDAATSVSFEAAGVCDAVSGDCSYTSVSTACPSGCDDATGLCVGDPCGGVTCDQPPGACFQAAGVCANGACSYGPLAAGVACDDGDPCTAGDACDGGGTCVSGVPIDNCGAAGQAGAAGAGGSAAGQGGDAGSAGAGAAGDGGGGGSSGEGGDGGTGGTASGGTAGAGGTAGGGGQASAVDPAIYADLAGGCDCAVPRPERGSAALSWAAALAVGLAARLRRRR
jgi:hypothetical protein